MSEECVDCGKESDFCMEDGELVCAWCMIDRAQNIIDFREEMPEGITKLDVTELMMEKKISYE